MQLHQRLSLLQDAVEHVTGRIPAQVEAHARHVLQHAPRRLAAGQQTVVALGGATGSGKSSLFNALSGTRFAEQSSRRPTTSTTQAVSFSATNSALLDLLGIDRRAEAQPPAPDMADVVLLDLPDHDSTSHLNRAEVDRMVGLVDQFVWVLDPQKYADAVIHERYLRPMAGHREVITVVLNHADRLSPAGLEQCLADIRRLLDGDGLADVPLLATSALTGQGIPELRDRIGGVARGKKAAARRLAADVRDCATEIDAALGAVEVPGADKRLVAQITDELSAAANVPLVVDAVRDSMQLRGARATGWPLVTWIGRLRPDPLKRLRLGASRPPAAEVPVVERSSLPTRSASSAAHQAAALRLAANALADPLPEPWRRDVIDELRAADHTLADQLDQAVVRTDLSAAAAPGWWQLIRAVQWMLLAAGAVGLGWLVLNAALGFFGLPSVTVTAFTLSSTLAVPLPTVLLLGGVAAGIAVSAMSRLAVRAAAKRAARRSAKALEAAVEAVARTSVLEPAAERLAHYRAARLAVDRLV